MIGINDFLEGPKHWEEGLALFLRISDNETLKQIFIQSGETAYNYARLLDELTSLAIHIPPISNPEPSRKRLYKERQQLHAQLMLLPSDEERRESAFRILEITEQLDTPDPVWRDPVWRDPVWRDPPASGGDPVPIDRIETKNPMRRLLNNRAYISKNRRRQDKVQEVTRRMQENELLERLLKEPHGKNSK